jgi:TolB-like protein/DNA-binding winged helix-turn-helix (wHTH) protein/Flp pilus assembly protein TadD
LEPATNTLAGPEAVVNLEPRVVDFAVRLARQPGQVMTREALIDEVWEGYPGADQSLTNAASKLRRALEEAGGDREMLETVPKRGYRLKEDASASRAIKERATPRLIALIAAVIALLVFGVLVFLPADAPQGDRNSIAVLAFEDLSPDENHDYLAHGIAEELLNLLARVPQLRVVGRTSSFSFAGKDVTIPEIGAQLNVDHVLEGSVRRAGDRLRITVQLLEAGQDRHLWSKTYEQSLDDVFAVQDRIATDIAEKLKVRLAGGTPEVHKTDPRTYALYLRAKFLFDRGSTQHAEEGRSLLDRALERDPDYVPALTLQVLRAFRAEQFELAASTIDRVLELDPDNPLAHVYRAWGKLYLENDPKAAVELLQTALPGVGDDPQVLQLSGRLLRAIGLFDEAVALSERAVERDPLCALCVYRLAHAYLHAGDLHAAETRIRRYIRLAEGGWLTLGNILLLQGKPEAALTAYDKQEPPSGHEAYWLSGRAMAFHELGLRSQFNETVNRLIEQWGDRAPRAVARAQAWAGNADAAFEWLNRGIGDYFDTLVANPFFEPVHDDPRWAELLDDVGLDPDQRAKLEIRVDAS